jgi:CRISPR system Cascade subunit CasD
MATLLLRLAGPMQSWGTQSRFVDRDTGLEPSKSGVLGLVCAALGRSRDQHVDDLAALRMGVRVDHEGRLASDYHTAMGVVTADGRTARTVVSNRYYLADADFLVGLEGSDLGLLSTIDRALGAPQWPLFLGRKAFVPGLPVRLPDGGVREDTVLEAALTAEPWVPRPRSGRDASPADFLRVVLETGADRDGERRLDQPGPGAAFRHRGFLPRQVVTEFWRCGPEPGSVPIAEESHA